MRRRALIAGTIGLGAPAWTACGHAAGRPKSPDAGSRKTLRVAFNFAETGFDPPQVSDLSSNVIVAHVFEPPYTYDYLARPALLRPLTAASLPEVSADFRRYVVTIRPGIFFADDPAFGGRPRELVAEDYVYSIKRYYDPKVRTEHLYQYENLGVLGLSELRKRAIDAKSRFDYDTPAEGLRALDRYRFEVRLATAAPRFADVLASPQYASAVAREVVERYADDLMAHPVGTGPFRLVSWRRGSSMVLERNPRYREDVFDARPPADDPAAQAIAARLAGKRLPLLDRIEAVVIDESQPRWLAFSRGELDVLELPADFAPVALQDDGSLAPPLARRGVQLQRTLNCDVSHTFFNFDDPVVGGYSPAQVGLRRAIALAYDNDAEVRLVWRGQAIRARTLIPPQTYGYDASLITEPGGGEVSKARALLDLFGFVDRDGDGWRERPDGAPLELRLASTTDQRARQRNELWAARMKAINLRMRFEPAPFGELIRRSLAGQLQMWGFLWTATQPDGDFFLGLGYGPNADQSNDARFRLAPYDALYEQQRSMENGPERLAAMRRASRLMLAYMPYVPHLHRIVSDLVQPHVHGYRRHPYTRDWWRFVDVEAPGDAPGA